MHTLFPQFHLLPFPPCPPQVQCVVLVVRTLVKKARNWSNMIVNLFLILFSGGVAGEWRGHRGWVSRASVVGERRERRE